MALTRDSGVTTSLYWKFTVTSQLWSTGYANKVEMELAAYGGLAFRNQMTEAWTQLKPLYLQLHAYTRRKLRQVGSISGKFQEGQKTS